MMKIEILSPVHVGTGNKIENPSYKINNDIISRYEFTDVLSQIPSKELINKKLLDDILESAKDSNQSKKLYEYTKTYVEYQDLEPKYNLKYDLVSNIFETKPYDIFEQIKNLDVPYIPGSTFKGTILNSFYYSLIKENEYLSTIKINDVLDDKKNLDIFELIPITNSGTIKRADFFKDLASCVICRDVEFNSLELFSINRVGGKRKNGQALAYMECISVNQVVENDFIQINKTKLNHLIEHTYAKYPSLIEILSKLTIENLLCACDDYTKDMLDEELELDLYASYTPINDQTKDLHTLQLKNQKGVSCLMRVGNSTNYNFKTVTKIFKDKYPYMKEDKRYEIIKSPKTRAVLSNKRGYVLPGFIKVTYDK